jgi:hypothetical protein
MEPFRPSLHLSHITRSRGGRREGRQAKKSTAKKSFCQTFFCQEILFVSAIQREETLTGEPAQGAANRVSKSARE